MHSVVIPVCNEADSLETLHRELLDVAQRSGYVLDIVFIDDGSTDRSWDIIKRLAAADTAVRGIRFRRNFGKAAALNAGFAAAKGDLVFTLDADLQDDPKEIPRFLDKMDDGCDVVSGWKKTRHDPWHKIIPSRLFNWLVSRITGVRLHDHNCGYKCYRRAIFDEVRLYGELHRFVPVLAAARGWKVGELVVHHRARKHGHSKYGLLRIPKGFLDLLSVKFVTGFGQRPQHMLGSIGLVCFTFGAIEVLWLTFYWWFSRADSVQSFFNLRLEPLHLHETAIFYYSLAAVLLGAQFVSVGFLAELVAASQSRDRSPYSISERTDSSEAREFTKREQFTSHRGGPHGPLSSTDMDSPLA